jgi:hypothetical protein
MLLWVTTLQWSEGQNMEIHVRHYVSNLTSNGNDVIAVNPYLSRPLFDPGSEHSGRHTLHIQYLKLLLKEVAALLHQLHSIRRIKRNQTLHVHITLCSTIWITRRYITAYITCLLPSLWGPHSAVMKGCITPCSALEVNRRFGGACRLHLQD